MKVFARLTKVDEEQRLVYGRATAEEVDRSGEILDYESSKPLFQKWSDETHKASDGKSLGNVRAMHGKVAAGKLTDIEFDDTGKSIDVCAKVVDDAEWDKVMEGVYTGFSIGGSYAKKWDDANLKKGDGKPVKRYTAEPNEVSLVDRPAVPSATFFEVRKADGSTAQAEFKALTPEQLAKAYYTADNEFSEEEHALLKASGFALESGQFPIADADDLEQAVNKALILAEADLSDEIKSHIIKRANDLNATDKLPEGWVAKADDQKEYTVSGSDSDVEKLSKVMNDNKLAVVDVIGFVEKGLLSKTESESLEKGLYTVGRLASLAQDMQWLAESIASEEKYENDTESKLPSMSRESVKALLNMLREMITEEAAEIEAGMEQGATMAMADFTGKLFKRGARNSSSDQKRIQAAHELLADLGASCRGMKEAADHDDDLHKTEGLEVLQKLQDNVTNLEKLNATLVERLEKLESQPVPAKAILKVVDKGADDLQDISNQSKVEPVMKADGSVDETATLIKAVHRKPGVAR